MPRTLHRLNEAAIRAAKPKKEWIVPLDPGEVAALAAHAAQLLAERGELTKRPAGFRPSRDDKLVGGLTLSEWKAVEPELKRPSPRLVAQGLKHPVVIRDGRPIMIRKQSFLLADGGGLYLQVSAGDDSTVRKSWIFKFATTEQVTSKGGRLGQW